MENQDLLITKEIEEEEKLIQMENENEVNDLVKKHEEKMNIQKELADQRHKRLMHLLTKSQFYSQYLLEKIESSKKVDENKKGKWLKGNKENRDSQSSSSQNSSQENSQPRVKRIKKPKTDIYDEKAVAGCNNINPSDAKADSHSKVKEHQPKLFENGSLRDYQLEGFSWLKTLYENGISGILADEMGLGKTVQIIAAFCHFIYNGIMGPFLVVAPLSTLPNWISEFERFAPKLPIVLYHGQNDTRKILRTQLNILKKIDVGKPKKCFPIFVTSYEVAIKDCKFLRNHTWQYLVVDEGHRLKNHKCVLVRALNSLQTTNRVILTGTPLQNNLAELWSLLHFLLPEIFDSLDVFESWFEVTDMLEEEADQRIVEQEREKQIFETLHKILSPFLLRRLKSDVNLFIPGKRERLVYVPLTQYQMDLYEATIKKDITAIQRILCGEDDQVVPDRDTKEEILLPDHSSKDRPRRSNKSKLKDFSIIFNDGNNDKVLDEYLREAVKIQEQETLQNKSMSKCDFRQIKMQNTMMMLRKIVNHPYLLKFPVNENGEYLVDEGILKHSGKLQVLDQLLFELHKRGHRVLLFSQMTKVLDILEDYLTLRPQFSYKRLDGSVDIVARGKDIRHFNEAKEDFLYLISTRAGGLGINLATADTVIFYDSDWNPQQDLQAQDRCHRIGQTQSVLVLRLVTSSTIDQKMVEWAAVKRKLEKVIMKAGNFKRSHYERETASEPGDNYRLDPDSLLQLLRSTDYERVHKATEGFGGVFTSEELELLLDRDNFEDDDTKGVVQTSGTACELKGVFKNIDQLAATSL